MPSRIKPTTPAIVAAAETTNGSRVSSTAEPFDGKQAPARLAGDGANARLLAQLELLRGCADALLTKPATDAVQQVFAKLAPPLALDALALYAANGEHGLTLDTAIGVAESALSPSAVAGIAAELERSGRRSLVLETLRRGADSRAALLRDLGFASAVVGALVIDGRLLGAVVLASRTKEQFSATDRALADIVVCYLAAAFERRELARHRHNAERRKREFLTVLAHELRNPLAPVRNALEIIRTNDRARSPVEHSAYAMIERQLQQIGRLADDLLDANQVVLGQVELAKQRVLLDGIIERAAEQSRPWIEAARHSLIVNLPREAIALDADPKRLARVFSNLVNAAARRMERGARIVISAETSNGAVAVLVRAHGRTVSGASANGIFADAVAHSELADGHSQGGFTAGMTLVKHLVEMHGGAVHARTADDGADEFEVRLPIVATSAAQPRKVVDAAGTVADGLPHRILIADDNADSAESMGMLLRLMGNEVRIASDGLEAVEQAAAFQPDIVLMDIGMPRLDGYEAARRIREQEWSRDTLLVAVTGWGPSDNGEEAAAAGFDRHFTKPLDPAELRRLVSAASRH